MKLRRDQLFYQFAIVTPFHCPQKLKIWSCDVPDLLRNLATPIYKAITLQRKDNLHFYCWLFLYCLVRSY